MQFKTLIIRVGLSLFAAIWLAYMLGGLAIWLEWRLIWVLLAGFVLLLLSAHIIAYCARNCTTKDHLTVIEYVYLSIAALGLCGVSTIDAQVAENQLEQLTSKIESTKESILVHARWSSNHYAIWPPDFETEGHPAKSFVEWSIQTKILLEGPFDKPKWKNHVAATRTRFAENPPWIVEKTSNDIEQLFSQIDRQEELASIAKNHLGFIIKYFGYWALAIALTLRIMKKSIETFRWMKSEE